MQRQQVAETKEEVEEAVHPILGQLVADLKYKRVYRTSIASLIKVPVWEKQRILRPERALAIAEAKLKKEVRQSLLGDCWYISNLGSFYFQGWRMSWLEKGGVVPDLENGNNVEVWHPLRAVTDGSRKSVSWPLWHWGTQCQDERLQKL